ncbi:MAG TPA: hypothetical protein VNI01_05745, partial [Elusimicrobiota bacterium]|nr:hypothetical protein [Elusimicrobiota bacterium]
MTRIVAALLGLSLLLPPAPVLGAGLRAQAPGAGFRSVPAAIFGPTAASSETSLSLGELSNSILET